MSVSWSVALLEEFTRLGLYSNQGITLQGYTSIFLLPLVCELYFWESPVFAINSIEEKLSQIQDHISSIDERTSELESEVVEKLSDVVEELERIKFEVSRIP